MVGLDKSVVNNTDFPGIDGLIDGGNPISLKASNGTEDVLRNELKKIATKANNLNNGSVGGHGDWAGSLKNGIDGMMSSTTHSKSTIQSKWNSVLGDNQINTDLVQNLYVQGSDGWLKWSRAEGWKNL